MLKFFRRIRKQLLREGQLKKYLTYSIGEILLVVLGILIALQINNWNEWRKDREKETTVLEDVAKNLELNVQVLENELSRIKHLNVSGDMVSESLRLKQEQEELTPMDWVQALFNGGNLSLSRMGYESLKNSGFDLLSNQHLKKEILNLYETAFAKLDRSQNIIENFVPLNDPFVLEHFFINTDEHGQARPGLSPRNFETIVNSPYFFGLLNLSQAYRDQFASQYEECLEKTQSVLQMIMEELNQE